VEGDAVKHSVSAPAAVVVLVLALLGFMLAFNRARLAPAHEHPTTLPWAPPIEAQELNRLRQGLLPLGIRVVMPPLAGDRFKGVRVAMVAARSPAAEGGLMPGDLMLSFNGRETVHPFALTALLEKVSPEETCEVVVVRAGEERKLEITGVKPLPLEERIG